MMQTYVTFRQVPAKDGETLAQTNNAVWVETSAKENINVGKYRNPSIIASTHLLTGKSL